MSASSESIVLSECQRNGEEDRYGTDGGGIGGEVLLSNLLPADSPRNEVEDIEHINLLTDVEHVLPPILVDRRTMRVIDGMHRMYAAIARGDTTIRVEYFDGSTEDAFLEAVRRNVAHGKPLSRADREAAAVRLLKTHHMLSDRALAEVCGLSPKTVGNLRRRAAGQLPSNDKRLGKDGKLRPVDPSSKRREAARILRERPDASIREVASEVGLAQATVADVRVRMDRGEPPWKRRPRFNHDGDKTGRSASPDDSSDRVGLATLFEDNALRSTTEGQNFLGWLESHLIDGGEWRKFVDCMPLSRTYVVAEVARQFAHQWTEFAEALEMRSRRR